jgi:hypothetical protein
MRSLFVNWLVGSFLFAAVAQSRAESTFAGTLFLPTRSDPTPIGGAVRFVVNAGEVSFQSTLFLWASATTFEPVLLIQNKVIPFDFGTGTLGSYPFEEFLAPFPGMSGPGTPCGYQPGIDPGFYLPVYEEGTRYIGSFQAYPGLEHLLLAKGGTLALQPLGGSGPSRDPFLTATLVHVGPVTTNQFSATLSGANEIPPNASPYHATGSFTLVGTCLSYSFAVDAGFAWTSAGLFGPARPHSSSGQLFADAIPFADMIMFEAGSSQVIRFGGVTLSDDAIDQLKRGKLYVSFRSAQYPDGEIRGQILPVPDHQHRHNGPHSSSK